MMQDINGFGGPMNFSVGRRPQAAMGGGQMQNFAQKLMQMQGQGMQGGMAQMRPQGGGFGGGAAQMRNQGMGMQRQGQPQRQLNNFSTGSFGNRGGMGGGANNPYNRGTNRPAPAPVDQGRRFNRPTGDIGMGGF